MSTDRQCDMARPRDRGISPVIGIVLMIVITVIIAAVVGLKAFGVTDRLPDAPRQTSPTARRTSTAATADARQSM